MTALVAAPYGQWPRVSELQPSALCPDGLGEWLSAGISLHAKAIMVDRKVIVIGSMNLDPRSRQTNTEVAVLIDSALAGSELGRWFDEASSPDRSYRPELTVAADPNAPLVWTGREEGRSQRYASEPRTGWWRRFVSGLLGALVPEELL